jgi:hypothetical protein
VEHHALHWDARGQDLDQVPRDGLALPILIRREIDLTGVLDELLQLRHLLLLLGGDDVERFEIVLGVDTKARPRLVLICGGYLGGRAGEVPDVPDRGLDHVFLAEDAGDGLRLRR